MVHRARLNNELDVLQDSSDLAGSHGEDSSPLASAETEKQGPIAGESQLCLRFVSIEPLEVTDGIAGPGCPRVFEIFSGPGKGQEHCVGPFGECPDDAAGN